MAVILRVKDDGSLVIEKFGKKSEDAFDKSDKGAKKASKSWKTFSKVAKAGSVIVAAAAVATLKSIIDTGAAFQQSMANVGSVSGATEKQLKSLTRAAREQAAVSVFSAREAADAQYFLASAGFSVNQIISAQAGVMSLAAATQADLAQTSEITTATLSQFELQASDSARVANVFAAAISGSQATIEKLGNAMRQAGPVANALDIDLESTTAAISLLFDAGFKGEQAGTILRASLIALQKPSAEAAGVIKSMGLQVNDSSGKFVGFESLIRQMETSQLSLNQAAILFGAEAAPGMLAMVSKGSKAYAKMRDEITGTNKALEMADRQLDGLTGDWLLYKSALEETKLKGYDVMEPALRVAVQSMTDMDATAVALTYTLQVLTVSAIAVVTLFRQVGTVITATSTAIVAVLQGDFSSAGGILSDMSADLTRLRDEGQALLDEVNAKAQEARDIIDGVIDDPKEKEEKPVTGSPDAPAGRGDKEAAQTEKMREEMELQIELLEESFLGEQELLAEKYINEQILLDDALANQLISQEQFFALVQKSSFNNEKKIQDIQKKSLTLQEILWKQSWNGKLKVLSGVLGMVANLMQSENKKQFELGKKAAIAQTVIDTYQMAVSSYKSLSSITFVGPILGAIAAAAAIAYGVSQVNKIKSQQFGGGSVATGTFPASPNTGIPTGTGGGGPPPGPPSPDEGTQTTQGGAPPLAGVTFVLNSDSGFIDAAWLREEFIPRYDQAKKDGADITLLIPEQ